MISNQHIWFNMIYFIFYDSTSTSGCNYIGIICPDGYDFIRLWDMSAIKTLTNTWSKCKNKTCFDIKDDKVILKKKTDYMIFQTKSEAEFIEYCSHLITIDSV